MIESILGFVLFVAMVTLAVWLGTDDDHEQTGPGRGRRESHGRATKAGGHSRLRRKRIGGDTNPPPVRFRHRSDA